MLNSDKTTLERAFELARSGKCIGLADLIYCLATEGYDRKQIRGRELKGQLLNLIRSASGKA